MIYPQIPLGALDRPEDDHLAYPYGTGRLSVNPLQTLQSATMRYGSASCSMQLFAYYDDKGGVMLTSRDRELQQKHYRVKRRARDETTG